MAHWQKARKLQPWLRDVEVQLTEYKNANDDNNHADNVNSDATNHDISIVVIVTNLILTCERCYHLFTSFVIACVLALLLFTMVMIVSVNNSKKIINDAMIRNYSISIKKTDTYDKYDYHDSDGYDTGYDVVEYAVAKEKHFVS